MSTTEVSVSNSHGLATRKRGKLLALFVATLLAIFLCWRLAAPFLPAIIFSVTLAIITHRPMEWLRRSCNHPHLTAGLGTAIVAVAFLLPLGTMAYFALTEISSTVANWQTDEFQNQWRQTVEQYPRLHRLWSELSRGLRVEQAVPRTLEGLQGAVTTLVGTAASIITQSLLTLFFLFFLYRDERVAHNSVRRLMPLDNSETDQLFKRVDDTVHATIFGTVSVALIQGVLGGIIFAVLGIPGAVLWGLVMGTFSCIPYLGSFVIWAPTALFLLMNNEMFKGLAMIGWGLVAIGLIDNLLYPMLVGQRLKQHTVVGFIAILGGVAAFGATGLILGPVLVTTTFFMLEMWRERTKHGTAAENA